MSAWQIKDAQILDLGDGTQYLLPERGDRRRIGEELVRGTDAPHECTVFLNLTPWEARMLGNILKNASETATDPFAAAATLHERLLDQLPEDWRTE